MAIDPDVELENLLSELKDRAVGQWVIEPITRLVNEGISEEKLLNLIQEELGDEITHEVRDAISPKKSEKKLEGIGGIMILPILGLVVTPILALKTLFVDLAPVFSTKVWESLTVPGGAGYHPAWAPIEIGGVIVNIILVIAPIILLIFMSKKLKIFPKCMVGYYLFIFLAVATDFLMMEFVMVKAFPGIEKVIIDDMFNEIMHALIAVFVWLPYFINSDRVQNTFVN